MARRNYDAARLERQADALLAQSIRERGRGEYPCFTERWMDLLARRERPGVEELPASSPGELEAKLGGMVVNAGLTRRQRMVIRWLARGVSQREIAQMLGLSESQVCRIKQAALQRLRRSEGLA
ncbi:MAG: sigma factor-like helix-turn-helix DNA-binding protein [Armatimonadota bacterium]